MGGGCPSIAGWPPLNGWLHERGPLRRRDDAQLLPERPQVVLQVRLVVDADEVLGPQAGPGGGGGGGAEGKRGAVRRGRNKNLRPWSSPSSFAPRQIIRPPRSPQRPWYVGGGQDLTLCGLQAEGASHRRQARHGHALRGEGGGGEIMCHCQTEEWGRGRWPPFSAPVRKPVTKKCPAPSEQTRGT